MFRNSLQLPPGKLQVASWRPNMNFDRKIEILALENIRISL
jgi:hypothetical protein